MNEERKRLEQRAQMTEIERLRHSTAHVLATPILCHSERNANPARAEEWSGLGSRDIDGQAVGRVSGSERLNLSF